MERVVICDTVAFLSARSSLAILQPFPLINKMFLATELVLIGFFSDIILVAWLIQKMMQKCVRF